jgi:hypothetical protein
MREPQTNNAGLSSIVAQAGARLRWSALLVGICSWLAACLGLWLLLFVCDNLVSFPAGLRLPLALGGAAFSGIYLFRKVLKLAFHPQTMERTAVMLEKRYGIRENLLINAVQFQRQTLRTEERGFAEQTIATSTLFAERLRFNDLWDWPSLRLWGSLAGGIVLLWIGFIALYPRQFGASTQRYLLLLSDVPPPGALGLKLNPEKDIVIAESIRQRAGNRTSRRSLCGRKKRISFNPFKLAEKAPPWILCQMLISRELENSDTPLPTSRLRLPSGFLPETTTRAAFAWMCEPPPG